MDIVHCNACFAYTDLNVARNYIITDCGHIFCENCGSQGKYVANLTFDYIMNFKFSKKFTNSTGLFQYLKNGYVVFVKSPALQLNWILK